jgi:multiple sugar transport system ATP-binding protein
MASVDFDHVEKRYPNGVRALSDCTLHVDDGELLVCVGPSGCGKSTLLRLLAGLESVTEGTIRIGARVVNDELPQERNVAMVFQDYALYPFMSVRGNLEFPLRMRQLARSEMQRRVDWVAGLLDIAPLLERFPKQLSGGQRQRVAMGRALVREPAVSLLDEPLSNLDAQLRVQVRAEIGELQRRTGTTMIYVTHDQVEAMTLGQRVAVLRDGRLQQVAAPRVLYDQPANVFVAGFIGNPPMNLFPTQYIVDARGQRALTIADQHLVVSPDGRLATLAGCGAAAPLTAGLRPEAFSVAHADDAAPGVRATLEHAEYLGHETLVHVAVGGTQDALHLIARLPGMHEFATGTVIRLRIDERQVHLFDSSGVALLQ